MILLLVNSGGSVSPTNPTPTLPGEWVFSTDYADLKAAVATGKHVLIPANTTETVTPASTASPTNVFTPGSFGEIVLAEGQMLVGADRQTSKIVVTNGGGAIEVSKYSKVLNL